jgi:hypothetical protein
VTPDALKGTDKVFEPGPNRVFVFGSNLAGRHGAGAALTAYEKYGAVWGRGEGLWGDSYAIPTKSVELFTLPLVMIQYHIKRFIDAANCRPDLYFFVTRIGCGLAGYTDDQIAPMFKLAPPYCELPHGWRDA